MLVLDHASHLIHVSPESSLDILFAGDRTSAAVRQNRTTAIRATTTPAPIHSNSIPIELFGEEPQSSGRRFRMFRVEANFLIGIVVGTEPAPPSPPVHEAPPQAALRERVSDAIDTIKFR